MTVAYGVALATCFVAGWYAASLRRQLQRQRERVDRLRGCLFVIAHVADHVGEHRSAEAARNVLQADE